MVSIGGKEEQVGGEEGRLILVIVVALIEFSCNRYIGKV